MPYIRVYVLVAQRIERFPAKEEAAGSSPAEDEDRPRRHKRLLCFHMHHYMLQLC